VLKEVDGGGLERLTETWTLYEIIKFRTVRVPVDYTKMQKFLLMTVGDGGGGGGQGDWELGITP